MSDFNTHTLNYTTEEILYFEKELRKYKLPWISRVWKKYGINILKYSILPAFIVMTIFGVMYNESVYGQNDWMWIVIKGIGLFFIFVFGLFALIGHLAEFITTNKLRRKLGLNQRDFKFIISVNQITGMN